MSIDAGTRLDALVYVLVHEATHVIDGSDRITPLAGGATESSKTVDRRASTLTAGVWTELKKPVARYQNALRDRLSLGNPAGAIAIGDAPAVYAWLGSTPFVTLYGSLNWLDDLA